MFYPSIRQVFAKHKMHGALRWAEVPYVMPHVARYTFASLLAAKNASIYKIARWLGDDVRVVEKHYAKLHPKDDEIEVAF